MTKVAEIAPKSKRAGAVRRADDHIHLRAASWQKAIIRAGAEAAGTHQITEYVLGAAIERAEKDILEKRVFAMNDGDWDTFMTALDAPAKSVPGLKRLLRGKDVFDA